MPTLRVLDLCCSEGGISEGIRRACEEKGVGVSITGVDIAPQPRYPFFFIQAEAVSFLEEILTTQTFDFIHVSPPCKSHTVLKHMSNEKSIESEITLDIVNLLRSANTPYTIENVAQAPIRKGATLFGTMFSLPTLRKRIFEIGNWPYIGPTRPTHKGSQRTGELLSVCGKGGYRKDWKPGHISALDRPPCWTTGSPKKDKGIALGITWMSDAGLSQAIPPAYAHHLFSNFLDWYLITKPEPPTPITADQMANLKLQKILHWATGRPQFTKKEVNENFADMYYCNGAFHLGEILSRAVKSGKLVRISRGIYKLPDSPKPPAKPTTKAKPTTAENQLSLF